MLIYSPTKLIREHIQMGAWFATAVQFQMVVCIWSAQEGTGVALHCENWHPLLDQSYLGSEASSATSLWIVLLVTQHSRKVQTTKSMEGQTATIWI